MGLSCWHTSVCCWIDWWHFIDTQIMRKVLSYFMTLSITKTLVLRWKECECGVFAEWHWQGKTEGIKGGNLYCNFFESLCLFCYLAKCIILLGQSKEYSFWIVGPLKTKTLRFSKTSGATHLTTQYHTPDNLNPQQHRRENLLLSYFYCNIQAAALYTEFHYSTLVRDYWKAW